MPDSENSGHGADHDIQPQDQDAENRTLEAEAHPDRSPLVLENREEHSFEQQVADIDPRSSLD
jgi:hypothetical protein